MIGLPPVTTGGVKPMKACRFAGCARPMVGAPGAEAVTVKVCVTLGVAALKFALPGWLATIVQVPAERNAALAPEIVQTPSVDAVYATGNADDAVPVKAIGEALNGCVAIGPNVTVWLALLTVNVNACVAAGAVPVAVMLNANTPAAVGVPANTPALVKVTPAGSALAVVKVGGGEPVAVTLKVPAAPTVKTVAAALVNAGGTGTGEGTTVTAAEAGPVPTAFLATTVHEYEFALTKPVTVIGDTVPVAVPLGVPVHVAV